MEPDDTFTANSRGKYMHDVYKTQQNQKYFLSKCCFMAACDFWPRQRSRWSNICVSLEPCLLVPALRDQNWSNGTLNR